MSRHNPRNERIKRQYLVYLREAKRQSPATVDQVAAALALFEEDTKYRDFAGFHREQAVAFKRRLAERQNHRTGARLSKATRHATLSHLRRFFLWLAGQPGYKSRLQYSDADYFNLSDKDARVATARREKAFPTVEQVRHVLGRMGTATDVERRNQALVAFTLLTGARDSAIASMKLRHIDLAAGSVFQDARDVKTKFSKSFTTFFFPVGDDVRKVVEEWVGWLREVRLWGNDDPLFPATQIGLGPEQRFVATGLARKHWSTAAPIRVVFREAFAAAGLAYFNPHSLRRTLVQLGERHCRTPEEFKAWSQNLGHEEVLTTFYSYGSVATPRQGEILRDLGGPRRPNRAEVADIVAEVLERRAREQGRF